VGGKDFVGLSTEQVRIGAGNAFADDLHLAFVVVRHLPAALVEAAFTVLVRRARSLHDSIEGKEFAHN
jgi:hypothetical protein